MTTVNEDKLMAFVGQAIGEWGALASAPLVVIGDRLGLYRAMADGEPVTSSELAARTQTHERYIREWLNSQAAGGFVAYDGDGRYHLEPEQAVALTDESSTACVLGGYEAMYAAVKILPRLTEAFRTGAGIGWGEQDPSLFRGTARLFRPGYAESLVAEWLPALDGVTDRMRDGAKVADVGCGFGHSTTLMARAFPTGSFYGFDQHEPSIDAARKLAAETGVADRLHFGVAGAKDFPGDGYELIAYFDCLHDMGDPVGALRHAREALGPGGTVMLVEPHASDDPAENMNPLGRMFYSASTLICTPASLSQEVGAALGAQAGPARLTEVAREAGFTHVRLANETPFNLVLELRA